MKLAPNADGLLDIVFNDGVVQEETFETLVLTSLLTNRRADPEDILPFAYKSQQGSLSDDRQGWVGDILDNRGRKLGSKLWLLDQELAIEDTRKRAIEYVRQCLKWMKDDGYVSDIKINYVWPDANRLDLDVKLTMANGEILTLRVNYETGVVYVL